MKTFFNSIFLGAGLVWLSINQAMAQCPDGCEGTFPNCAPCFDPSTPIDEATGFLLVAGVAVGVRRLLKKKQPTT